MGIPIITNVFIRRVFVIPGPRGYTSSRISDTVQKPVDGLPVRELIYLVSIVHFSLYFLKVKGGFVKAMSNY